MCDSKSPSLGSGCDNSVTMATPLSSPSVTPVKRAMCPVCLRAQATCICALVVPTPHTTDVLILQHPLEVHHAKNTARLLHLSLGGSRLVVGEAFDEAELQALVPPGNTAVLLYPPTSLGDDDRQAAITASASRVTLVVLDATWRKSRKMLHLSPALQRLPRLALHNLPPSAYAIRKAHTPGQLSTLEATCAALAQLEQNEMRFAPLLNGFKLSVCQQLQLASVQNGTNSASVCLATWQSRHSGAV